MGFYLNTGDIYALLTALCWSSAVILFDLSSRRLGSLQMNLLKNFIGMAGFVLTLLLLGEGFPKFSSIDLGLLVFSGVLGVALGDLLFLASLRRLGAGLTAIVSTSYSPAVFLFAFLMFKETITTQSYAGAVLVTAGISVGSLKIPAHSDNKDIFKGVVYGVGAQALTAYSVFLRISKGRNALTDTMKTGLKNPYLVTGALLGTYLSVILWLSGYKYTLAGRAAIYNQLSTILIILMAAVFLKEPMTTRKWMAVGLAVCGALLVSSG